MTKFLNQTKKQTNKRNKIEKNITVPAEEQRGGQYYSFGE